MKQNIRREPQIMSQKEKEYVEMCFKRSFNVCKTEIDYGAILDGQKTAYEAKKDKKEKKILFGRNFRKSKKHFRESCNTETDFLDRELHCIQFYEILAIFKYIDLDTESLAEIEENIIDDFNDNFEVLISNEKTFQVIEEFIPLLSEKGLMNFVKIMFYNCQKIRNSDLLFKLLDSNIDKIPADESFINNSLWTCSAGYILGIFLLLKDQDIVEKILDSFICSDSVECPFREKFITLLKSLCNGIQKQNLEKKIKK